KLKPSDWANAAGSTLASAVVDNFGASGSEASAVAGRLQNGVLRLATNAVVAGALSRFDKDAAESYLENAIGQEVGQFIGDSIGGYLKDTIFTEPKLDRTRFYDPTKKAYVDKNGEAIHLPSADATVYQLDRNGQVVDQDGNPAPKMYA